MHIAAALSAITLDFTCRRSKLQGPTPDDLLQMFIKKQSVNGLKRPERVFYKQICLKPHSHDKIQNGRFISIENNKTLVCKKSSYDPKLKYAKNDLPLTRISCKKFEKV